MAAFRAGMWPGFFYELWLVVDAVMRLVEQMRGSIR
jgi:hypothetical protein